MLKNTTALCTRAFTRCPSLLIPILLSTAITLPSPAISQDTQQETPTQNPPAATEENKPEGEADGSQAETAQAAPATLGPAQQYRYDPLQQQTLIEAELKSTNQRTESVWLTANETNFLALWNKDKSGKPQGAVLILPSENTNPANLHKLSNIQSYLSENGWSTLTLSMPKQLQQSPPDRPAEIIIKPTKPNDADAEIADAPKENEADVDPKKSTIDESKVVYDDAAEDQSEGEITNANEASNTDANAEVEAVPGLPPEPVEPEALARIAAGIQFLQDNKQFNNIVLADGISAARIVRAMYSEEAQSDAAAFQSIRGLILLNSLQQLEEIPEFDFLSAFEKITVPTFDIIESASGRAELDVAMRNLAQRKSQARASKIPVYLSRKIQPTPLSTQGELRLTRIIRGFLYQHAQGMERKPN